MKNLAWLAAMALTMGMGLQPMNVEAASTISYEHNTCILGDAINLN